MIKSKKLLIGGGALALAVLAWTAVIVTYVLFDPSLAQWTLVVTIAALSTELLMWVGAAILGITALQRFSAWYRLRRAR